MKKELDIDVLTAAALRVRYSFDHFEKVCVSFSGGKDSTVLLHLAAAEARKRDRKIAVLVIDLEAQYGLTIEHVHSTLELYSDCVTPYWVCLPIKLRNAVSNYEPTWCAWDPGREPDWVRRPPKAPGVITDPGFFDFFCVGMEFEEFVELFASWYSAGALTASLVGIRADESLNRWRTICKWDKEMHAGKRWTTAVADNVFNVYPIYDWKTADIWRFHARFPELPSNKIYDRMHLAGVPLSQMRLCQPYGDDQRRGLWLYHLLEPQTWGAVVARVNGVNSGALYIEESGNVTGYGKIHLPPGHTWKSFCNLLLSTMPAVTREHYLRRFKSWLRGWHQRGYIQGIPDFAPPELEKKYWAPSWRRLCKVLLRNDWWCKGLGMTQPRSEAYQKFMEIKRARKNSGSTNP